MLISYSEDKVVVVKDIKVAQITAKVGTAGADVFDRTGLEGAAAAKAAQACEKRVWAGC